MNRDHAQLVTAVLKMAVTMAKDADDLNAMIKTNRLAIDQVGEADPKLWNELKTHTQARRAALLENASPLTKRGIPRT